MNVLVSMVRVATVSAALLLAVLLSGGCASSGRGGSDRAMLAAGTNFLNSASSSTGYLRVDDMVTVVFSGVAGPPEKHEERIKEDGTITLQLVGPIKAEGKTAGQLQEMIQALYVPKYFQRLTVTVLTENRFFYVSGEVKLPNRIAYVGEMSVLKAIASAGGFTDFAKKTQVQLSRPDGRVITVNCTKALEDPSLDLPVSPGDKVHVPRRLW
jgi:protein involved in polysaccharide export with SLBB domain